MLRVVAFLVVIGVALYAFIDCLRTPSEEVDTLPKPFWIVVILVVPLVGGLLWIMAGRRGGGPRRPPHRPRVIAPDDDPDFLRSLDPPRRPAPPDDRPDGGE